MGDGVLGVLILHRRSEKNLVAFFFKYRRAVCPCPYIGFCLLAWLFNSVGWGLAFLQDLLFSYQFGFSAPIGGVNPFVVSRVQKTFGRVCCMGTALSLYPFLSRYSSMAYFLFSFSVFDPDLDIFLSVLSIPIRVYPRMSGFFFDYLFIISPFPIPLLSGFTEKQCVRPWVSCF